MLGISILPVDRNKSINGCKSMLDKTLSILNKEKLVYLIILELVMLYGSLS